jgi:hypothetical protein
MQAIPSRCCNNIWDDYALRSALTKQVFEDWRLALRETPTHLG